MRPSFDLPVAYEGSSYGMFSLPTGDAEVLLANAAMVLSALSGVSSQPELSAAALQSVRRAFWCVGTAYTPDWFTLATALDFPSAIVCGRIVRALGEVRRLRTRVTSPEFVAAADRVPPPAFAMLACLGRRLHTISHVNTSRSIAALLWLPRRQGLMRVWYGNASGLSRFLEEKKRSEGLVFAVLAYWVVASPAAAVRLIDERLHAYCVSSDEYEIDYKQARSMIECGLRDGEQLAE